MVSRYAPWDRQSFERSEDGFPYEEAWARRRPDLFRFDFATADLRVYRVLPPASH